MSRPNKPQSRSAIRWLAASILILAVALLLVTGAVVRWMKPDFSTDQPSVADLNPTAGNSAKPVSMTVVTPKLVERQNTLQAEFDPSNEGWFSEKVNQTVSAHFQQIRRRWSTERPFRDEELANLTSVKFRCQPLRPTELNTVYQDRSITVRRDMSAGRDSQQDNQLAENDLGTSRLAVALNHLRSAFAGFSDVRAKFKTIGVEISDQRITTTVLFQAFGKKNESSLQQDATWDLNWDADSPGDLRLLSIDVLSFEEVAFSGHTPTLLSDCTRAVLGATPSFRNQLQYGSGFWMQRLDRHLSPRLLEGHIGFALGDVNNDGREDLYVCQPGGLPNRLYIQKQDGSVADASSDAGVDILDWSHSALILDLNNDGNQDLAVLTDAMLLVLSGDGTGQFTPKAELVGTFEYALSAADFDNDGDLDLYACNYFAETAEGLAQLERTDPLFNSNTGGRNALFRNEGDWKFVDATHEVGLDVNNERWSLAAAWEDYDNDGDQDLYVVNDFGHNSLYRNDRGQFVEVAAMSGAVDANQGMSVTWADYNHDGWMDVYVSNMFSAAGKRVTRQPGFLPGLSSETRQLYQQLARGNTLLENPGNGVFRDVSVENGVTMGRWAWASLFADLNNDGWEDLLIANGYLTQDSKDDL